MFRGLLTGAAALLVFLAVWGALSGFLAQAAAVTAGNTGDPAGAARTNGVGAVLTLLGLTPSFLGAAVLLWGARLAGHWSGTLRAETVELCRITAERCRRTAQCAILLCVGGNLLQLLLLPQLRKVSFTMTLPLVSVALSAALFLLCRYFQQGKAIHDDNRHYLRARHGHTGISERCAQGAGHDGQGAVRQGRHHRGKPFHPAQREGKRRAVPYHQPHLLLPGL